MARSMTVNVRVNGPLGDFIADNVGEAGTYENVSEYVLDLIRKDKDRVEAVLFERLRAALSVALAAPDDSYSDLTADEVIARNSNRKGASLR